MKVHGVLKLLKDDGWYLVVKVVIGSSNIPEERRVTVPGKRGDDLPIGTLNSVFASSWT